MFSPFHLNNVKGPQVTELNHVILGGWPFEKDFSWNKAIPFSENGQNTTTTVSVILLYNNNRNNSHISRCCDMLVLMNHDI